MLRDGGGSGCPCRQARCGNALVQSGGDREAWGPCARALILGRGSHFGCAAAALCRRARRLIYGCGCCGRGCCDTGRLQAHALGATRRCLLDSLPEAPRRGREGRVALLPLRGASSTFVFIGVRRVAVIVSVVSVAARVGARGARLPLLSRRRRDTSPDVETKKTRKERKRGRSHGLNQVCDQVLGVLVFAIARLAARDDIASALSLPLCVPGKVIDW